MAAEQGDVVERLRLKQRLSSYDTPGHTPVSNAELDALIAVVEAADDLLLWEPGRAGYAKALHRVSTALAALHSQASDDPLRNPPPIPDEDLERAKDYVRKRGWVSQASGEGKA